MEYLLLVLVLLVIVGQVYVIRAVKATHEEMHDLHTTAVPPKAEPNKDRLA